MIIKKATASDKDTIKNMILKSDIYHYEVCKNFAKNYNKNPINIYVKSYGLIERVNIEDFYILEINKKCIGTIMVWDNNGETTLTNFYIDKEYRNLGYGKKLIKYIIINNVKDYCVLGVFKENKNALKFYKHIGFKYIQTEKTESGDILWLKINKIYFKK